MLDTAVDSQFQRINRGYNSVFAQGRLSVGLVVPLANYDASSIPAMDGQARRIQLAEELGFSAVWLRDVPFNVSSFGDAGQIYDPFVYLGLLAGKTHSISLGVASMILPLRHPAHVAKAAASVDVLSEGRLILGVASGDRPEEYPALNVSYDGRGERFRESFDYIRQMAKSHSRFRNSFGSVSPAIDLLPKPESSRLPLLITGSSQQSIEWIAENGDGWMLYPRDAATQATIIRDWRSRTVTAGLPVKPAMEPLYIDLSSNSTKPPKKIHLGYSLGTQHLVEYLKEREEIGVNHVALNLRFNHDDIETTLRRIADDVLPNFTR